MSNSGAVRLVGVCPNVRKSAQAFIAMIAVLLLCPRLYSQVNTGRISGSPDVINGNPVVGSGGPRDMQLALRLMF